MKLLYSNLCILLIFATTVSASTVGDIIKGIEKKLHPAELINKLKHGQLSFRQFLNDTRGNWHSLKDDLFDVAVDHLKIPVKNDQERHHKKAIFEKNLNTSERLSRKHKHAFFGINKLSFITFDDFKQKYLWKPKSRSEIPQGTPVRIEETARRFKRAASSVDLRSRGAVSAIRDQQACGSCWAFVTAATLETANFKKTGQLVDLSEQQLVNCDSTNNGCNGGWFSTAYTFAKKNGIPKESSSPYQAAKRTCSTATGATVKVSSYSQLYPDDVTSMKNALSQGYMLAVAMRAGIPEVYHYQSGILDDKTDCTGDSVDHAVAIVGYDTSGSIPYWIVRNTWGTDYGENGYFRIKMGINYCNIETYPFIVTTA